MRCERIQRVCDGWIQKQKTVALIHLFKKNNGERDASVLKGKRSDYLEFRLLQSLGYVLAYLHQ